MARWSDCYEVEEVDQVDEVDGAGARAEGEPRAATGVVVLQVYVQPGAGRTAVVGRHGQALKLRVAAPPVDDRANTMAGALLADLAGIGTGSVELVAGPRSRMKRFRLRGIDPDSLDQRIDLAVAEGLPGPTARR